MNWIPIKNQKPPENKFVNTKIDDEKGVRNIQTLKYRDNLWWGSDKMYVYYTPTHWAETKTN